MVRRFVKMAVVGLAALGATSALAKDKPSYVYERPDAPSAKIDGRDGKLKVSPGSVATKGGVQLKAQAGVGGYSGLGGAVNAGPTLGVQVAGEASRFAEVEMGYQASRNGIDDARVGDGEAIYRHNVNLFAKVGPKLGGVLRPFVGAGVGASYANVTPGAEGRYRNDFFQETPIGAGLDFNSRGRGLTAGVRGTWSPLYNDEFAEATPASDNPGNTRFMTGLVTVGGRF